MKLYPNYQKMQRRLASRSYSAIRNRARRLGIAATRHVWTNHNEGELRRLYLLGASRAEVNAAFPGLTQGQICSKATHLRLVRARKAPYVLGIPRISENGLHARPDGRSASSTTTPDFGNGSVKRATPHEDGRIQPQALRDLLSGVCRARPKRPSNHSLSALGDRILSFARGANLLNRGFILDMADIHDRRNLASACVKLGELGVLDAIDGDAESFVKSGQSEDRSRDVLYDVNRGPLASILACVRGPSTWPEEHAPKTTTDRISAITAEFQPETDEGRRDVSRQRISRRLLDDPVVYNDTVGEADMPYFMNQRGAMANRLALGAGLVVELRSEGLALCDPDGNCSDVAMPADGTDAHVTLLVADHLAHTGNDLPDRPMIEKFVAESAERYGKYWRRSAQGENGARDLAVVAIHRLSQLKLITVDGDRIAVLPALARYKLGEPDIRHRHDGDRLHNDPEESGE